MNKLDIKKRAQIVGAMVEGVGINSILDAGRNHRIIRVAP